MVVDFTIWDTSLVDKLTRMKDNPAGITKIIFNGSLEYQYNYIAGHPKPMTDLIEFAGANNIELHIITCAHPADKLLGDDSHVYVHYWSTFWLTMTYMRLSVSPNYPSNIANGLDVNDMLQGKTSPIIYPYITMNKAPKVHRAIMMDMLAKHKLIDKGVVIWRELCYHYQCEYWKQKIMMRDQLDGFASQETLPIEYVSSFAQLVTESDEYLFCMSEKTVMPLFFNKPFLVAGCKHFHAKLKDMGFLLYDELFDYSFDAVDDIKQRYEMIAKNFAKYADKTPAELMVIYNQVFDKCVYNKKLAIKLALTMKPKIWDELVNHQLQNNIEEYPSAINIFIRNNERVHGFY